MVQSDFERLGKTVNLMVERFSALRQEKNELREKLEESEKRILDLVRKVEELGSQKDQVKWKLDGLLSRLEKLNF
jgi:chromosome segregation ATPase